jgi:flavorubredoxin
MKNLLIVYHSQSGNTEAMAKAIAEGAKAAGATVTLKKAVNANDADLLGCDAVAIGTPNYFSYMAGMVKDFFDRIWAVVREKMADKPYVAFGSYGGGGTVAIETVEHICDGLKMKKICEAVSAQREPTEENLATCKELGKKMAEM